MINRIQYNPSVSQQQKNKSQNNVAFGTKVKGLNKLRDDLIELYKDKLKINGEEVSFADVVSKNLGDNARELADDGEKFVIKIKRSKKLKAYDTTSYMKKDDPYGSHTLAVKILVEKPLGWLRKTLGLGPGRRTVSKYEEIGLSKDIFHEEVGQNIGKVTFTELRDRGAKIFEEKERPIREAKKRAKEEKALREAVKRNLSI